ncbi:hypothetical protein KBC75_01350 [Candidatus Shapirobacteria bacterium]|nr:hypothetical protein [Candidatus Shapirobacteria bacterium]
MFKNLKKQLFPKNESLESIFLEYPNVFNYSPTASIQYATKAFTYINLNLEIIASDPKKRQIVVDKLLSETNNYSDIDYICGIESGGSYFASAIADRHQKKLIMLRRREKIENNNLSRLVGQFPPAGSRICLIDDVLSTGLTLFQAKKFFTDIGCSVIEAKIIYSYGFEKAISRELDLKISVISNYNNLIKIALEKKILTTKDTLKLNRYISSFKQYLTRKKII